MPLGVEVVSPPEGPGRSDRDGGGGRAVRL